MRRVKPCLALVVPCYNEAEGLPHVMGVLGDYLAGLKRDGLVDESSFVYYVDDGSKDGTWALIQERHEGDEFCKGLKLAGNVGHQNALLAGMVEVRGEVDCIVSLDADLQDDVSAIAEMLKHFAKGSDIVYGVRNRRATDTWFKRGTAGLFYKLMGLLKVRIVPQHADYRLVSRAALEAFAGYGESNVFLRGIFPSMGFASSTVHYARKERLHGESKYPLRRMLSFAWQGVTSFSAVPLRLAGLFSLAAIFLALVLCCITLVVWWKGETVSGWTSLIIATLFLGGVQLFCLTIIGEYLAKIYMEVKRRPRYIVERTL